MFNGFSINFNSRIYFFLASAFYIKKLTTVKNMLIFIDCLLQHILSLNIIKGTVTMSAVDSRLQQLLFYWIVPIGIVALVYVLIGKFGKSLKERY